MKTRQRNKFLRNVIVSVILCLLCAAVAIGQNVPTKLEPGNQLERQIKGGDTQDFQFKVKAGQFARVEVVPTNIDVIVSLIAPDGKTIIEMDGDSSYLWRESVSAIAEKGGNFKLQIKGKGIAENSGNYTVKIAEQRKSAALDRKRIEAEQALVEAIKLGQADKPKESAKIFETSLNLWKEIGDKYWEAVTTGNLAWAYFLSDRNDEAINFHNKALLIFQELKERIGEAGAYSGIGSIYRWTKKYDLAKEYLEKGLAIRIDLKRLRREHGSRTGLMIVYYNLNETDKFLENYDRMLAISDELNDKNLKAQTYKNFGDFYLNQGRYDKIIEFYEKALLIYQQLKDTENEIYLRKVLGLSYAANGEYNKAIVYFEKSLEVEVKLKNRKVESDLLLWLGVSYGGLSNYEKAQIFLIKALEIKRQIDDKNGEIEVLNFLVIINSSLEEYDKVIEYSNRGLIISNEDKAKQIDFLNALGSVYGVKGEIQVAISYHIKALLNAKLTNNKIQEADTLTYLTAFYSDLGQYAQARDGFQRISEIALELKDTRLIEISNTGLGSVYADLNQNDKANNYFNLSLVLMQQTQDKRKISKILSFQGDIYLNSKAYEQAIASYEQSLAIAREVKNKQGEVYPLIGLGAVYLNKNQFTKAQEFYEQGLKLAREVKDRSSEGYALNGFGALHFKLKKYKEAEDFYQQALAIAKEVQSKKLEALVLWNLMELHKELKKPEVAIVYGKQAVNIFQEVRGNIKSFEKETQQSYVKDKESAYRTLADLLIAEGRFPEAQDVLNFLKEEEYSQLTRDGEKGETIPYAAIEAELLEKTDNLIVLERQYKKLQEELLKIKNPNADQLKQVDELSKKIEEANTALKIALGKLAEAEESVKIQIENFYKAKEDDLQVSLQNLRIQTKSGVVALYTLLGKEETAEKKELKDEKTKFGWVILVTEKGEQAYPIDVTNLNQLVFKFQKDALGSELYDPQPLAQKIYNAVFRQKSAKQKRTLEQDLEEYLGSYPNKTLMWSLDGVLRYIPMAALHDGKSYLVEKYLNVAFTEKSIRTLEAQNNRNWKILGLGVSEKREGFVALPNVKKELEEIVREGNAAMGIFSGEIKLNENFKKGLFFNTISGGEYPVIHIATHYSFKPTQMKDSFLLAGDGNLTFDELIKKEKEKPFSAVDLLTLSACETGVSANGKEAEGFPIVAQKLGAKAVIASLWKVPDKETPELMIQFYKRREANSNMSKGEAFRQAQLFLLYGGDTKPKTTNSAIKQQTSSTENASDKTELSLFVHDKNKPFAHPFYWSSFVLYGNWK